MGDIEVSRMKRALGSTFFIELIAKMKIGDNETYYGRGDTVEGIGRKEQGRNSM
jgi:hypothetical protein